MKNKRLYYVIMPLVMAFTLIISLFAPLVPTDLSSATQITTVKGLTAGDAKVTTSNGKDVTSNSNLDADTPYTVSYNWAIPDGTTLAEGDTIQFELPDNVQVKQETTFNIDTKNEDGASVVVATATIPADSRTGTITINNNASVLNHYGRTGELSFTAYGKDQHYANEGWYLNKSGWTSNDESTKGQVYWQILYNYQNKDIDNVIITDTMGSGQKYVDGSMYWQEVDADEKGKISKYYDQHSINPEISSDGLTLTIDLGHIKHAVQVVYRTQPDATAKNVTNSAKDNQGTDSNHSSSKTVGLGGQGDITSYEGKASLKKVSSTDSSKTLEGAFFEIIDKDNNDKVIQSNLITDSEGKIDATNLKDGNYAFKETKAPSGYELNDKEYPFEIKEGHRTDSTYVNSPITNTPKDSVGKATLTKVDAADKNKTLSGAVFKVINTDTNKDVKTDLTTNDKGQVVVDGLAKGNYAFVETTPPDGYQLDATEHKFTITGDVGKENSVEVTATNKEDKSVGKATLTKVDANDSSKKLSGAVFEVIDKDNNDKVIDTLTTDDNGQITTGNLSKGNYAFKETKAPKGYKVNDKEYPFEITGDKGSEGTYEVTVPDESNTTSITVNKVWNDVNDADGKRPSSIKVQLYKNGEASGDPVAITGTGNTWTYTFDNLDKTDSNGKNNVYTVKEVDTPEGYTSDTSKDSDGNITITNTHTPTTDITVTKDWEGDEGFTAFRKPVEVQLLQNGKPFRDPITLSTANAWEYKYDNLPKNDNTGKPYEYTVKENTDFVNYQSEVGKVENGEVTITNTYEPTKLTVKKVWNDSDDQDGQRPSSVTVHLLANGMDTGKTVILSGDNNWTDSFSGLNKYDENDQPITYSFKEDAVDGYKTEIGKIDGNEATITNTHTPKTTNITVNKVWNDKDNQDGKRPSNVTVHLLKNGEDTGKTVTLNSDNNWKDSFDNLPVYENGQKITYSVKEVNVPGGYTSSGGTVTNGEATITNTYTPETTNIEVNKSWDDSSNVDKERPKTVTVKLLANGEDTGKTVTLTSDKEWKDSFDNLPVYKNGKKITYTVQETDVPSSYTSTASEPVIVNGNNVTITNSHTPATTHLLVNKKWVGGDLLRPSEVQVQLYANGKESGNPVTLNLGNNWSYKFDNLPENDKDGKIIYTVREVTDVPNYTSTQTPGDNAVTITNTYKPGKTQLNVNKVWNDTNNQDKLRPDKITVQLYKTVGKTTTKVDGKTVELTAKNDWAANFTDLDATDSDGNPITYTAKEDAVPTGYGEKYEYSNDGKSETITNTHPTPETTNLTVNKVWNDKKTSHPSVKVQLYKVEGNKKTAVGEPVTLSDKAGWSHTFDKLAKDATYTVEEVEGPSGYISEVSKAVNGKVTITNTPEAKTQVTVKKAWNDSNDKDHKRPTSVEAQLYANGNKSGDAVELTADKNWTYTWTDLPQNDSKGNKINYSVKEENVPTGYTATSKTDGNVTTITNTYPAPETTSLKVNKTWKNGDPNLRPTSVEVQLYANGEKSGEPITLNQGNNWSYDFKNLVKNDDNGEPIKYTVEETTKVANYTSTQTTKDNAVTITNTYTPGKTQFTVNKVWNDDSNKANLRPSSVKVQLYANDQKSGEPVTINADKDGNWSYTFDNLDETDSSGKKITYTAKEVGVPEGYGATYEYSKDGKTETITNTHPAPETKKLTVDKIWSDNNSSHSAVKVQLYKVDGKDKTAVGEPVTLSSADGWTHTFTDLDKNSEYTVAEVDVPNGYTSEVSPVTNGKVTITNTLNQTSLTVNKVWKDSNNKAGKRPSSIQVQLYANNEKSGKPVTIKPNAEGDWTYTFSNLDEVDENDKVISYRAEEVNVPEGYASTSKTEGKVTTITNTYPAPETTSFKVTKDWKDNNNEYGLRPSEVTVQLLANGKNYGEPIVLNQGNNWTHEFTGLPKADTIYSVKEITNLANYTSTVDTSHDNEAVITNTVIPPTTPPVHPTSQKTQLTVNKVWNDNNNQDGKRPSEVTVKLLANGKETGKSVELSDKNNWVATFGDLDRNDSNGNAISYTVEEVKVDGYTAKVDKVNDEQVTITNTRDTVPPTKPTTPSQPVTPPTKPITPSQPVVPPVKSTTTTTPTTTTSKTNKPETFTDQVKQVVNGLLPQTGADRRNAIITYVGLIIVIVVIISWGMITVRKRNK